MVTLKRTYNKDWEEYSIQYFINGKYSEAKTHYASDKEDMEETLKSICKQLDNKGTVYQVNKTIQRVTDNS